MRSTLTKFLVLLFLHSLWGCTNKMELDASGTPSTLIIAAFAGEGPEESTLIYEGVAKYLEKKLGMPVELVMTTDYTTVIEALRSKKAHIGYLSSFAYVLASHRGDFNPIITIGNKDTPYSYKSIILTHKNSGLRTMEDVKARAKNLTLCFSDPASTSGHLVPRAYLTQIALDPETSFKQILFASSHAASVMTVNSGKVDLGCTYENALQKLTAQGNIHLENLRLLWTSDAVVNGPIVMRSDINEAFTRKVQQCYLELPTEDSVSWKNYLVKFWSEPGDFNCIIANDSMYNGIRNIVKGIKDLKVLQ